VPTRKVVQTAGELDVKVANRDGHRVSRDLELAVGGCQA